MFNKKRGYWIKEEHIFRADKYICSRCRGVSAKKEKRCPHCGAAMGKTKADPKWVDELEFFDAIMDD